MGDRSNPGKHLNAKSCAGLHTDEDPITLNLGGIGFDVFCQWSAHSLAITNIEFSLMERALNLVALKESIAQPCIAMSTEIVSRKNFILDPIQRNAFTADINAYDIVFGIILGGTCINPLLAHFFAFQIG